LIDVKSAICADEKRFAHPLDGVCRCDFDRQFVQAPGGTCIHVGVVVVVFALPLLFVMAVLAFLWKRRVTKMADVIWEIKLNDLVFDDPPQVLGRGTFGLVLAATYNTTSVAVKRVMPSKSEQYRRMDLFGSSSGRSRSGADSCQSFTFITEETFQAGNTAGNSSTQEITLVTDDLVFKNSESSAGSAQRKGLGSSRSRKQEASPPNGIDSFRSTTQKTANTGLQTTMGVKSLANDRRTLYQRIFSSENAIQRNNFIKEMRFLSKMRHPCITTVMGAVVASDCEPMLVMECMEYGSLHDLIHNYTMVLNGELVIPLLVDVCQGLSFLHSSKPPLIHGDLKSANVLVDGKFRAKVTDFGALSGKKSVGACGTPFWMAPELLLGELNSLKSDVYAFGVMVWEVYARQDPYIGEDPDAVLKQVADVHATPEKRPEIPEDCPFQVQEIMKAAWHNDPSLRPSFSELEKMFQRLDTNSMGPRVKVEEHQTRLLNDVFPKHIADKLRKGEKIEPEHRDCVTIFFSDIVGFTEICSMIDASKVSEMLDRLYTAFDALSSEHKIFKVETIGDAYMAVTNLVEDQANDHALCIAHFAVHAIEAANSTLIDPERPEMGTIKIRVGFHSGPVVANVVGTRNQRYCLFGDTVNTASRMESSSEAGRIHCSDQAAKILKQQIALAGSRALHLTCRGEILIKGKGTMTTHWVSRGKLPAVPVPVPGTCFFTSFRLRVLCVEVRLYHM
jgi:serine/threonine protein kinase